MPLPRIPRIAIVGRPNVGKSSLLNMLAGAKVSIVDPTPGVTRDRVAATVELEGPSRADPPRTVEIIDTGGYGVYTADGARFDDVGEDLSRLSGDIENQIGEAVRSADIILFVIDAQAGLTALDDTIARLLREQAFEKDSDGHGPEVIVVANKVDGDNWEAHGFEASALGFGEPLLVSALNNFRRRDFVEALYERVPDQGRAGGDEPDEAEMRLAIVGKRNAGKSTFVNALAGEQRVIISEIAGTTRDAIDVRFAIDGHSFIAIDTAGFRKRKSLADQVEWWSTHRALRAIRRADVALLLLDASTPVSQVDKQLAHEVQKQFKPCVIVVNKWDVAQASTNRKGKPLTPDDYRKYLEQELKTLSRAPIVFASAHDGRGVREAVEVAQELHAQARERLSTGRLNRVMRDILERRGPSSKLGKHAKVLFVTQVAEAPPTIVMVVNHEDMFTPEYRRYLLNRLAESTPFEEVPIRLIIRDRKRARLEDLLSGAHAESKAAAAADSGRSTARADRLARPRFENHLDGDDLDDAEVDRLLKELEAGAD